MSEKLSVQTGRRIMSSIAKARKAALRSSQVRESALACPFSRSLPFRRAELPILGGNSRGAAAVIQAPFDGDWTVEQTLRHFRGHTDIVRGCQMDMGQGTVVSCGEDGLVCLWSAANSQAASADASVMAIPSSESASPASSKPLKVRTRSSSVTLAAMLTVPAATSGRHRRARRRKQRGMRRTELREGRCARVCM